MRSAPNTFAGKVALVTGGASGTGAANVVGAVLLSNGGRFTV